MVAGDCGYRHSADNGHPKKGLLLFVSEREISEM